jgi:hypothetical protein
MAANRKLAQEKIEEMVRGNGHLSSADSAVAVMSDGDVPPQVPTDIETDNLPDPENNPTKASTISRKKLFIDSDEDLEDEVPVLASCGVHRPPKEIVFRTRPGKQWRAEALIIDFRAEDPRLVRGKYLIVGPMQAKFKEFGRRVLLVTCVSSTGQVFLWDINVVQGFGDSWYRSDLQIVHNAERYWTRFLGQQGNAHGMRNSKKDHGEPRWPGEEIKDIYDLALLAFSEERLVEDMSHPLCDYYEIE